MKKLLRLHAVFAVLVLVAGLAQAQDPSFSQYHNTPFLTNPGMLSVKPDAMVGINYRNQWRGLGTPFTTFMLQGYYPILSKDKFRTFGSAGAFILTDRKPEGFIRTTGFGINGAYKLPLNFANFMHFGIQFSYFQNKLGLDGMSTGSQWNGSNYDPALSINEDPGQTKGVPAVSLGAQWVNEDAYGDIRYMAGLAAYNLNRPNLAFYRGGGVNDNLSIRYVLNGGIRAVKVDNITVFPTVRLQFQGPAWMANLGSIFRYGINQGVNRGDGFLKAGTIGVGAWYQVSQAVIAMVEFTQPEYAISLNYDFGASSLRSEQANANAAEFFIMYKKTLGRRKKVDLRYYRTREQQTADSLNRLRLESKPAQSPAPAANRAPTQSQPSQPTPPPANASPAPAPTPNAAAPATQPAAPKAPAVGSKKVTQKGTAAKKPAGAKPKAANTSSTNKLKPTPAKTGAAKSKAGQSKTKPKAGKPTTAAKSKPKKK